jgi:predicted amidohydrolase YtcJ
MESCNLKVILNAKIYEGRGKFSQALCIEGGRIAGTGGNAEILESVPAGAEKIDAGGSLVIPAFNDSHLHMLWLGRRESMIDGAGASSIEEVLKRGRDLIARLKPEPGTYVQGAGVNPDLFTGEKRDLNRSDLDKISTEHPVIISRHCGHTIYCNSLALKMAGLDESAPQVEGGTFEKDADGRPTGVLRENANALVREPVPALGKNEIRDNFRIAMKKALSLGITSVGSCDVNGPDFDDIVGIYREIYAETGSHVRVTMQCGISNREDILAGFIERGFITGKVLYENPEAGPLLKMGPVKLFLDGTLGGQTAWMRHPYKDKPETSGFAVIEEALLGEFVKKAAQGNIQIAVHTIGDAALNAVVSAFEEVTSPGNNPLRHGVIHCQVSRREDLERMARNKILALVQPIFLADDMHILESRVGPDLASTSYAWGSMEKLGIQVSYGTDAPVCDLNPLLGISWAVNRRDPLSGLPRNGFYPAENVDVSTAVDAYASGSAYSAFSENYLGYIKSGYLADLAFVDKDIFTVPSDTIHTAKVTRTMLAGETVWEI